jgi:hypothetical protein
MQFIREYHTKEKGKKKNEAVKKALKARDKKNEMMIDAKK